MSINLCTDAVNICLNLIYAYRHSIGIASLCLCFTASAYPQALCRPVSDYIVPVPLRSLLIVPVPLRSVVT